MNNDRSRRKDADRRRKKRDTLRRIRQRLTSVFHLNKDTGSYLSLLPHELITIVLRYSGFPENDVRLVARGFDQIGLRVRVVLPLWGGGSGTVIRGQVTRYDGNYDEHHVRLWNGEEIQVQMAGIGCNGYHIETEDDFYAGDPVQFPSQPSEVTLEWMNEKFMRYDTEVVGLNLEDVVFPPLEGDTCQACKATLDCRNDCGGGERQINCFIKFGLSLGGEHVDKMWASGCHQREVFFYSCLHYKTPLSIAPECYYAHCDPEQRQSVIVLEDLSEKLKVGDSQGLTQVELRQALLSLALLHSSFWNTDQCLTDIFADTSKGSMKHVTTMPLHVLSSHVEEARPHLQVTPISSDNIRLLIQNIRFLYFRFADLPVTLIHADARPCHLFFSSASQIPATIIDWQRCQPGIAIRDVAILLASGCVDQPEEVHHELLTFYSEELGRCVYERGYFAPDAYADYQLYLLLHLLELAVFVNVVGEGNPERQEALRTLLHRVANVICTVQSFDVFETVLHSQAASIIHGSLCPAPKCFHRLAAVRHRMMSGQKEGKCFFGCCYFEVGKGCGFFEWSGSTSDTGETGSPVCVAHGEVTEIRYSLKPRTLGKAYYCCSIKGDDQCRFFKWLEDGKGSSQSEQGKVAVVGRVCRNWSRCGQCSYGKRCYFADSHTSTNLPGAGRVRGVSRSESQPKCRFWRNGRSCPYGQSCYFAYSHV